MSDGYFDYVSPSLKNVLREFARDRLEVILAVALVVLVILGAITVFVFQRRRARRRKRRESEEIRQRIISGTSLSPTETDLLDRLIRKVPDWRIKGHSVLQSKTAFDAAARKLLAEEAAPGQDIAGLRIKLGLTEKNLEKVIHSSTSLPPNTHILLVQKATRVYARVMQSDSEGLAAFLSPTDERQRDAGAKTSAVGPLSMKAGEPLTVYFKTPGGTFHFQTRVLSGRGSRIVLAHSETIQQTQRRRYYRCKVNIPAWVKTLDSDEERRRTKIVNLSGGGAKLANPAMHFPQGSEIQISFRTETGETYALAALVERLSARGQFLHVSFEQIGEPTRDKLINYVLMQRRKTP